MTAASTPPSSIRPTASSVVNAVTCRCARLLGEATAPDVDLGIDDLHRVLSSGRSACKLPVGLWPRACQTSTASRRPPTTTSSRGTRLPSHNLARI